MEYKKAAIEGHFTDQVCNTSISSDGGSILKG